MPIPLKKVISVSSEDQLHKAINLISPTAGLYWTSSTEHKMRYITVELEMAKLAKITQIEVGNFRSAFVEVLVSDSYKTDGHTDYVSLLPQSILMTAEESKNGRNTTRTKIFGQDKLSRSAQDKKWKYITVKCIQPYLSNQPYGLRYIKFFQTTSNLDSPISESGILSIKTPPTNGYLFPMATKSYSTPRRPKAKHTTEPFLTPQSNKRELDIVHTPKLPTLDIPIKGRDDDNKYFTSSNKRMKKDLTEEDSQEFEFAGLENQSRLLNSTIKGDSALIESNPVLNKIANERKTDNNDTERIVEENGMRYVRRKLLHKELKPLETTDLQPVDFISSYDEKSANLGRTQISKLYSSVKLSKLDNPFEMGDEPSPQKQRWGSRNLGNWVKRRGNRKKEKSKLLPLSTAGTDAVKFIDVLPNNTCKQSTLTQLINVSVPSESPTDNEISTSQNCPICNETIPIYALELHASVCAEHTYDTCTTEQSTSTSNSSTSRHFDIVYLD